MMLYNVPSSERLDPDSIFTDINGIIDNAVEKIATYLMDHSERVMELMANGTAVGYELRRYDISSLEWMSLNKIRFETTIEYDGLDEEDNFSGPGVLAHVKVSVRLNDKCELDRCAFFLTSTEY